MCWGLAVLLFIAMFAEPGPPIYQWITPVITNIGCGFLIRWLRPRMLANAHLWDQDQIEEQM